MSEAIRKIIVAGSGPVAWIAAAGLSRALRSRAVEVSIVATEPDGAVAGYWTLPSQRGIHALLGVNEPHFIHHTGSTFRLATEHRGWQGEGSAYLHAHGEIGSDIEGTPYYKYLLSEALAGRPAAAENFSVAGAAARLGRFARPMGEGLTASFTYGFHIEEPAYTRYLQMHAQRLGVRICPAVLADVELAENGNISALRLNDGILADADLFIDCSGAAARLIRHVSSNERDDWSAWLPCDRMLSGMGPALRDPAPVTQTVAAQAGWMWRAPLVERSMAGMAYSSAFMNDDAAHATLAAFEPGLKGEVVTRFSSGRRRDGWVRNCVALGAAAVELEPLAGASLHLAQLGLATLVELFPLNRSSSVEAREFNRLMGAQGDSLRDFTIAHYRLGRAPAGDFWTTARAAAPPANLAHKLDLFAASGRINLLDHETFEEIDWAWLLIGGGCVPAAIELHTRQRLAKLRSQDVSAIRTRVQQVAASMPPHAEFVRRQTPPVART
ncbi:MAG TPA: tryptophan halogenase family protein [Steroidobacteraceae bacterium]|nr:tryptophan halogenase family protein [Steroidobacteraceae bacterium]